MGEQAGTWGGRPGVGHGAGVARLPAYCIEDAVQHTRVDIRWSWGHVGKTTKNDGICRMLLFSLEVIADGRYRRCASGHTKNIEHLSQMVTDQKSRTKWICWKKC